MKSDSLRLIEDVCSNYAKLSFIEISEDSIYLDFIDVELGLPKSDREIPILLFAELLLANTSTKVLEISTNNCTFVIKIYT